MNEETASHSVPPAVGNSTDGLRECGLMITVAAQGVGKSHANKLLICEYVRDKIERKVRGRKVLIFDTNGEYASSGFGKDGIPPLTVKTIRVADIEEWCKSPLIECRRIDVSGLTMDDKEIILNYTIERVRNCLFILEDLNKVVLDVAHLKIIVGTIVGLRHRACDVIASYQALRDVPPRFLSNCKYARTHYYSGDAMDVKGKLSEPEVYKIAQIIVNERYYATVNTYKQGKISEADYKKRRSFYVYVYTDPHKISGAFSKETFVGACKKYLRISKGRVNDEMQITGCKLEQALANQAEQLFNQYYGNKE